MIRFVFYEDYPGSHCEARFEGPGRGWETAVRKGGWRDEAGF